MSQVSEIIVNWTPETSGRVVTIQVQSRIVGTTQWTEQAASVDASLGTFRFGSNAPATMVEVQARFRMVSGVYGPWKAMSITTAPVTVPYVDLTGTPSKLSDINTTEGSKLTGIAPGADVTANNTAKDTNAVNGVASSTITSQLATATALGFTDTTAPSVPTGLALSSLITDQGVTLSATWTASTASDFDGYVFAIKEGSGNYSQRAVKTNGDTVVALKRNSTYTVKVAAYDRAGNTSAFSGEVSITTARDTVAPALPAGLSATPTYNSATLAWTNASDTDLDTVEVWRATTNNSASATKIDVVNAVPGQPGRYVATNLAQAATFYFFLKSVDTSLNASVFTAAITATTAGGVSAGDFTPGLSPISTVASLPTASGYTGPNVVLNQSDGKLYRYSGGAWTSATSGADITASTVPGTALVPSTALPATITVAGVSGANTVADAFTRASWGVIAATPANLVNLMGSEAIKNTDVVITNGVLNGIGVGSGTAVGNSLVTIGQDGKLVGAGGGQVSIGGLGYTGALDATKGAPTGTYVGSTLAQAIESFANDPAARIANVTTTISGVKITDDTIEAPKIRANAITADKIAANSVNANKITVSARALNTEGITFQVQSINGADELTWTGGYIHFMDDSGAGTFRAISAGNTVGVSKRCFVYWNKGATIFSVGTSGEAVMGNPDALMVASYQGGKEVAVFYGSTIVDGERITTGSIDANRIKANTILADTIQVGSTTLATVSSNAAMGASDPATRINSGTTTISGGKITTGSITALQIAANTISTNKLVVASRPISTAGVNIRINASGQLQWDSGGIIVIDDSGSQAIYGLSANAGIAYSGTSLFVYYVPGNTFLSTSLDQGAVATNPAYLQVARWDGGTTGLHVYSGFATLINGDSIVTGTLNANKITANTLTGNQIIAGTISTAQLAAGAVTTEKMTANTINADRLLSGTISGDKISTTTSLPGSITVGNTGVTIETIRSMASDPAARIAANSTKLGPGTILLQGSTTLGDVFDQTLIKGGYVKANSITADKLTIAGRGLNMEAITFEPKIINGSWELTWTSGYVQYMDDNGQGTYRQIAAGNTAGVSKRCFIYYEKGESGLRAYTAAEPIMGSSTAIMIGCYMGGTDWAPQMGSTIINGAQISTNSIEANKIKVTSLSALTANIGEVSAGVIRNADSSTYLDLTNGNFTFNSASFKLNAPGFSVTNPFEFANGALNLKNVAIDGGAINNVTITSSKFAGSAVQQTVFATTSSTISIPYG